VIHRWGLKKIGPIGTSRLPDELTALELRSGAGHLVLRGLRPDPR
jgi:hypothetical protein